MLARYREAFTPSRTEDVPTDAAPQLALLLTPRDTLLPLTCRSVPRCGHSHHSSHTVAVGWVTQSGALIA